MWVAEWVEIGVCALVGVLVTNGKTAGVVVGDSARAGNVGDDDIVSSALI